LAVDKPNVSDALEMAVKFLPLGEGSIARGAMQIPSHPRVDDVVYVVPLRRAHQEGGPVELWERG
jgi:hypothetical protein